MNKSKNNTLRQLFKKYNLDYKRINYIYYIAITDNLDNYTIENKGYNNGIIIADNKNKNKYTSLKMYPPLNKY
jgi:hypothetical protein